MDELREWIRVAEAARVTCLNAPEFDDLIQHQKQRLEKRSSIESNPVPIKKMKTSVRPPMEKIEGRGQSEQLHDLRDLPTGGRNGMTSKLDIASGHIRAAIQMIAIGANPHSTHVIVMACEEMLRSIADSRKVALAGSLDHAIKKDRLAEWRKHIRSAYNFFKHANRDVDANYDGPGEDDLQTLNQIQTMLNCASYQGLSGSTPEEMTLFMNLTAFSFHANVFDDEFFKKFPEAEATAKKLAGLNVADVGFGLRLMLHERSLLPDSPV